MPVVRLIATDLDGTLLGEGTSLDTFNAFRSQITALRERNQACWVISTGRGMRSFRSVFHPLQMIDLQPDYVILRHAMIFGVTRWGFVPHRLWNLWVRWKSWKDRLNVLREINRWHRMLALSHRGVRTIEKKRTRLCLSFSSEEEAATAADLLRKKAGEYRHLQVFRYLREVDVRAVPFTKGLAVAKLAQQLKLRPDEVLTIGDGHNDISMFDPAVASLCGCPSNAAPEIMKRVRERGGHIARLPAVSGSAEVIDAFVNGHVNSDLPPGWEDPEGLANPMPAAPAKKKHHQSPRSYRRLAIGVVTVYAALLVFASFDLVPGARWIMKPYRWLDAALAAFFEWSTAR